MKRRLALARAVQSHRSALTQRLPDAVKRVTAHFLRGEDRAAYFRTHLLHP